MTGWPAASARSRCSIPSVSTRPSGGNTRICRKCGYSAATRPRLPHMPRTIASIRAAESSGKAARKLRRARLETPRRGPIQRATVPPVAEAMSSGSARIAAKNSAAPQASILWDHRTAAAGSVASGVEVASVMAPRQRVGEELFHHVRVAPADLDVQHLDAAAQRGRQPNPILRGGEEGCALAFGQFVQPSDFIVPKRMMIREGLARGQHRAESPDTGEEFFRLADPGKRDNPCAGETLAIDRVHLGR